MASKIAQVKMPKLQPLPLPVKVPKAQPSMQTQIFRNNRTAMHTTPMAPQKYPKFMGKTGF